jgi:hypothetical protein
MRNNEINSEELNSTMNARLAMIRIAQWQGNKTKAQSRRRLKRKFSQANDKRAKLAARLT